MGSGTKCILVTMRVLILLACIPAIIPFTFGLKIYFESINLKSPTEAMPLNEFIFAFSISLMAALGILIALFGNRIAIRALGIYAFICMVVLMLNIGSKPPISDELVTIANKMETMMPFYNWGDRNGSYAASAIIDEIQRSRCCGTLGPNDWWILRPSNMSDTVYPASCCDSRTETGSTDEVSSPVCNAKIMNRIGCMDHYFMARTMESFTKSLVALDLSVIVVGSAIFWAFYNQYDAIDSMCYS